MLLERSAGKVSFLATDIEVQIRALADLDLGQEAHAITVGARKLVDILRALPGDAEVTLQMQDKRMLVKAGKSRFMLQTLPAEDFPRLAKPAGEPARFALPQKGFKRLLGLVQYAMAQQDIRYYLNGLLMVVEEKQVYLLPPVRMMLSLEIVFLLVESNLDEAMEQVVLPPRASLPLGF